jgi:hypothetical protein
MFVHFFISDVQVKHTALYVSYSVMNECIKDVLSCEGTKSRSYVWQMWTFHPFKYSQYAKLKQTLGYISNMAFYFYFIISSVRSPNM